MRWAYTQNVNSISIDGVGKRIGQQWALKDVSFKIAHGEIFGIFGRSGSGKSTLLKLIAGLEHPSTGSIELQVSNIEDSSWLDAKVSIALQTCGLAPELTVAENLGLFTSLWGAPRKRRISRSSMFVELMSLSDVRDRQVRHLPDGQKAAVEIARAFIAGAEVTAIDGLLERLDRPTRRRAWEHILARRKQGATFIIGTSSAEEAHLCDKIIVLSKGRLAFFGKPDDLCSMVKNEVVVVESIRNPVLKSKLQDRFGATVIEKNGAVEFRTDNGEADVARILTEIPSDVGCVYLRPPTLDDALDRVEGEL